MEGKKNFFSKLKKLPTCKIFITKVDESPISIDFKREKMSTPLNS